MTETSPEPTSNPEPEPLATPVPASQPDAEDRNDGEKPPTQPESIANESDGVAGAVPLHGSNDVVVVNVPHVSGVAKAPRGPPKNVSLKSLNGSCGLLVKVVVS